MNDLQIVKEKIAALIKKAKEDNWNPTPYKSRNRSSLHVIINTPEKAKRFMKLLELAETGEL
jgi:hypothetical protein